MDKKRKGTNLENEFKDIFEKHGYKVIRSAGSFSTDLIAIKKNCKPLFINVKWIRNYCGPNERQELIDDSDKANGIPILAYKSKKSYGKRMIEVLTDAKTRGEVLVLDGSKYDLEDYLRFGPDKMLRELWSKKEKQTIDISVSGFDHSAGLHPVLEPKKSLSDTH